MRAFIRRELFQRVIFSPFDMFAMGFVSGLLPSHPVFAVGMLIICFIVSTCMKPRLP